ncbi:hypothetical protein D4R71_02210 [bacterium]|nr:MAG: hypothetical protein D4R71_02210 [bacterium]
MLEALSRQITTLVIAASSLFSSHVTPIFDNCSYHLQDNVLVFSGRIINCYTKDLDQIMQSGQEIVLEFTYRIHEQNHEMPLHMNSETHSIKYDVVDRFFTIDKTESRENFIFLDFSEAKQNFVLLEVLDIQHIDFFEEGRKYYFEVTAYLHSVYLEEMEKNIELMKYWNNKSPTYRSPVFSIDDLKS